VHKTIAEKRMQAMFQVVEFTDADDFTEVIFWIEDVIVQYKFKVINYTVIQVVPVATVIDAVQPSGGKASFADVALTVYHNISWAEKTVVMQGNYRWNFPFAKNRQNRGGQPSFI